MRWGQGKYKEKRAEEDVRPTGTRQAQRRRRPQVTADRSAHRGAPTTGNARAQRTTQQRKEGTLKHRAKVGPRCPQRRRGHTVHERGVHGTRCRPPRRSGAASTDRRRTGSGCHGRRPVPTHAVSVGVPGGLRGADVVANCRLR